MEREPVIQHWLVAVARAAAVVGSDELSVASDTPTDAAWDLVSMATGISHDRLADQVGRHFRLPRADLSTADPHAWRLVPARVARRLHVLPLSYTDRSLTVATADPVSLDGERELAAISGRNIHSEVAPPAAILAAVEGAYPREPEVVHQVPRLMAEERGGPHALVVDDDPVVRHLIRTVLVERGFRVTEAPDGTTALTKLQEGDEGYDLVSLDLILPDMNGLEVLQKIRSRLRTAALPVIVATGTDDPRVEMELFEAGADDFVVKPLDPPRFLLRVQAVLRRRDIPLVGRA